MSDSMGPHGPGDSPGQNTEVGSLVLLQGIFPTQGLNPGLLHCRWILYQLSHKGSPFSQSSIFNILFFCSSFAITFTCPRKPRVNVSIWFTSGP